MIGKSVYTNRNITRSMLFGESNIPDMPDNVMIPQNLQGYVDRIITDESGESIYCVTFDNGVNCFLSSDWVTPNEE